MREKREAQRARDVLDTVLEPHFATDIVDEKTSKKAMAFTDFDILADSMITDNPSLTAPNTSSNVTVLPEWVSDQIFASTYFEVGLSALTLIVAAANAFWLHYRFPKTLVFRIQKVDSITTSVSQLGFITTLFSSITENPDPFICTVAAALYTFNMYHFIWTSLSISLAR